MRTLIGSIEPDPSPADAVLSFATTTGVSLTDWQVTLIRWAYGDHEPIRTAAHVGRPIPEIKERTS